MIHVCVKCQAKYEVKRQGVPVVETAGIPPKAHRIWRADLLGCPICGAELLAHFAHEPMLESHEQGFEEKLEQLRESGRYILHNPPFLVSTYFHETKFVRSNGKKSK